MDLNGTYCSDCFALYANTESLGCTLKTSMIYLNKNILLGEYNSDIEKRTCLRQLKKIFIMKKRGMHGKEMKEYRVE